MDCSFLKLERGEIACFVDLALIILSAFSIHLLLVLSFFEFFAQTCSFKSNLEVQFCDALEPKKRGSRGRSASRKG